MQCMKYCGGTFSSKKLLLCMREITIGNVSRVLKGEMPRIVRAEDKDKAKMAWELIYKKGSTLKGKQSSKTVARTPGTPLP